MDNERLLTPNRIEDDGTAEPTLRPAALDEFVGQEEFIRSLRVYLEAARGRGEPLDHVLLSGLPGLGKTTLARIVSHEMETGFHETSGPAIEKAKDLVGVLTRLEPGDVLFIDEVHRIPRPVEEYLYSAMEDSKIDIFLDKGPHARSIPIHLPPFTLVAATTREGLLSAPFRARFGILGKLELYPARELERILLRSGGVLDVRIDPEAVALLASRSRGVPRIANRFLRRIRDLAQVKGDGRIDRSVAAEGLSMLGVDGAGLDGMDRKILDALSRHGGRPVGLKTVAVSVGEEEETIEEVYEPYLIREGFLVKSPRGRIPTRRAFEHLGVPVPHEESLF